MNNDLEKKPNDLNSWVRFFQVNSEAHLRLFCFSYAGGGASVFRTWSKSLSTKIEVCPIELPGRGSRLFETPLTRMEHLIEKLATVVVPYLDKPFAFFGHSMGGLVSYELACLLKQKFEQIPVHLFVSGCLPPHLFATRKPIHALPESNFLQELYRLKGTPKEILENAELMQLLLPSLRADFAIIETHIHRSKVALECPITAFDGLQDPEVNVDSVKAWSKLTNSFFSQHMLPGDHFFLHSSQNLLLDIIANKLY